MLIISHFFNFDRSSTFYILKITVRKCRHNMIGCSLPLDLITLTSGGQFTIGLLTLTLNVVADGKKLEIAAKKVWSKKD